MPDLEQFQALLSSTETAAALRAVVSSLPGLIIARAPDGKIPHVNENMARPLTIPPPVFHASAQ
jgi:hypothetical protein